MAENGTHNQMLISLCTMIIPQIKSSSRGDSILTSGENFYEYDTEFASQPVQLRTSTSFTNYDKNTLIITAANGTQYHMFVGAIADAILHKMYYSRFSHRWIGSQRYREKFR